MNLARLKTFLVLTERLNFSEAAEQLYCTQPTVSMHIRALEEELGCSLFDRVGKKLYLNHHGESFKPYAQQIVELWQSARENAKSIGSGEEGVLSFGASHFVGVYLLPALLSDFKVRYPKVKVCMQIRSSATLLHQLEDNEVDFLVISDQISLDESLHRSQVFCQDELVLVVPAGHPLGQGEMSDLKSLEGYTQLWKPEHSATRTFLETALKSQGVVVSNEMEISSLEAIKQGVIHNLGIAFISRYAVAQELAIGTLQEVIIPHFSIQRGISHVARKDKLLPPPAKHFIAMLQAMQQTMAESARLNSRTGG